jgi:hypothetical protein
MVKHEVEAEELQAYLDGELTPARQAEIEQHLRGCADCAAVLEDLKRVSAALQQWQVEPAPASLRPPAVELEKAKHLRWWRWQTAAGLAAAAAVVLVVVSISIPSLLRSPVSLPEAQRPQETATATREAQPAPPPESPRAEIQNVPATPPKAEAYRVKPAAPPVAEEGPAEAPSKTPAQPEREADRFARERKEAAGGVGGALADRSLAQAQPQAGRGIASGTLGALQAAPSPGAQVAGEAGSVMTKRLRAEPSEVVQLIAYHVSLTVETKEFAAAKKKVETVVEQAGGYIAQAHSAETPNQPQRADLTLRVPAEHLHAVLDELRGLGRVVNEQISSEEVTGQVVDLETRLRNARATEQRLIQVLNERTGKVRDILEVEREIGRTRQEIERMDAQRQNLLQRAQMATIEVALVEEFKAQLQPAPVGTATRLRNAFVEGYQGLVGTLLGFVFFFARYGLSLLFWGALLWLTGRGLRRGWRRLSVIG